MKQIYPSQVEQQLQKITKSYLLALALVLVTNMLGQQNLKDAAAAKGKYIDTILNINFF